MSVNNIYSFNWNAEIASQLTVSSPSVTSPAPSVDSSLDGVNSGLDKLEIAHPSEVQTTASQQVSNLSQPKPNTEPSSSLSSDDTRDAAGECTSVSVKYHM